MIITIILINIDITIIYHDYSLILAINIFIECSRKHNTALTSVIHCTIIPANVQIVAYITQHN